MSRETVITVGSFDCFHKGHRIFLKNLALLGKRVVVGVYNDATSKEVVGRPPLQNWAKRSENVGLFADATFGVKKKKFMPELQRYVRETKLSQRDAIFCVGHGHPACSEKQEVFKLMEFLTVNTTPGISSAILQGGSKIGRLDRLLKIAKKILEGRGIPFHLDTGTLLGAVRDFEIMPHDTDADVTIHLSSWDDLNRIDFREFGLERTRTLQDYPRKAHGNMISVRFPGTTEYLDIHANPAFPRLSSCLLNGTTYPIPENVELYLKVVYGQTWRTPSAEHSSVRFHRNSGLVQSEYRAHWDKSFRVYKTKF